MRRSWTPSSHLLLPSSVWGPRMGTMSLAEVGDSANFDSPDKILAYAGLSPSTYESGKLKATGTNAHMEKCGSRYIRYATFNATQYVS